MLCAGVEQGGDFRSSYLSVTAWAYFLAECKKFQINTKKYCFGFSLSTAFLYSRCVILFRCRSLLWRQWRPLCLPKQGQNLSLALASSSAISSICSVSASKKQTNSSSEWDPAIVWNRLLGRYPLRPKPLPKRLHKRWLFQVWPARHNNHDHPMINTNSILYKCPVFQPFFNKLKLLSFPGNGLMSIWRSELLAGMKANLCPDIVLGE